MTTPLGTAHRLPAFGLQGSNPFPSFQAASRARTLIRELLSLLESDLAPHPRDYLADPEGFTTSQGEIWAFQACLRNLDDVCLGIAEAAMSDIERRNLKWEGDS